MASTHVSKSKSSSDDGRRNPRRTSKPVDYKDKNQKANAEDDENDDEEMELEEEDDDDEQEESKPSRRKRSSSQDMKKGGSRKAAKKKEWDSPLRPDAKDAVKSPAARHKAARRQVKTVISYQSDNDTEDDWLMDEEEEDVEDGNEEDEEEEFKIQRIIASKSERRRDWNKICASINTSEIVSGSRWFADEDDEKKNADGAIFEERFLVKWDDLSFMHCSWETQKDLFDQIENSKNYLSTFFRKSQNGLLYTADERCDGDYFDPRYTQIERILEVELPEGYDESQGKNDEGHEFGIIMDTAHPDYESGTGRQFLIKWGNTPYSDMTFEFERDLIMTETDYKEQVAAFYKRSKKPTKSEAKSLIAEGDREFRRLYKIVGDNSKMDEKQREDEIAAYQKKLADKIYPNGGQLRDYQAEGVSWMMANYVNGRSSLLADEMGLGKTLQTASFVNLIATEMKRTGPCLVVAPLSTLEHWKREFTNWTGLNTIVFHGSAKDREQVRESEFAYEEDRPTKGGVGFNSSYLKKCQTKNKTKLEKLWMVDVVVTTPEMIVTDDFTELTAVDWEILVVDEAHRLKNHASRLATNLREKRFSFSHKLLLTGTPIQNNMTELWTLLNFIDDQSFEDKDEFLDSYGDIKSKEGIDELHESIRPYILRRLKEDVEKSVPPKEETLIEVELTVVQKQYYRALYEKNVQFLHRNKKKALDGPSLNNLAMQLRKCCNHPFLLNGVEDEMRETEMSSESKMAEADFLVKSSGKLVLLDKLLPRLREKGHRILIFSQFKIMLDILEDYFAERKFKAERIDGSITGNKRQMAIDRFQAPPSPDKEQPFIMMLSTRAGGVGINLTAADTCIIFDSDWNPQNDLQAQARCHRIGQTKSVKVYRLLTRKTYEMQMFHMSSLKMGLDQAVLQGFESNASGDGAMSKDEIEKLLRHGAYDIFNEDKSGEGEAESNAFIEQDIDSILARRTKKVVHENTGTSSAAAGGTFSKASFKAPKTPGKADGQDSGEADIDIDDPDFWKKMVGEAQVHDPNLEYANKKRRRNQANYSEQSYNKELEKQFRNAASDASDYDDMDDDTDDTEDYDSNFEPWKWGRKDSRGWRRPEVEILVKALQTYGYGTSALAASIAKSEELSKYSAADVKQMSWTLTLMTLREAADENVLMLRRRIERDAQKRRQSEGKDISADSSGGVLAVDPEDAAAKSATVELDIKKSLESEFRKLVESNKVWLGEVFRDAKAFAKTNSPRSKEALERAINRFSKKKQAEGTQNSAKDMNTLFAQNLWPQLKSRGWKASQVENAGKTTTKYVHGSNSYKSPEAVMTALAEIHPELKRTVEEVQQSIESMKKRDEEEQSLDVEKIESGKINTEILDKLMNQHSPLQLLADRIKTARISLAKKLLHTCATIHHANRIVNEAKELSSDEDILATIANAVVTDKRSWLPHPLWSNRHDAVLICAIAKHGWIENDSCCRAITEDKSISWGAPFEKCEKSDATQAPSNGLSAAQRHDALARVAARARDFMNVEREMIDALRDFKEGALVKMYSLRLQPATDQNTSAHWVIEGLSKDQTDGGGGGDTSMDEAELDPNEGVDLPTKKELLKRAKAVLSKNIVVSVKPAPKNSTPVANADDDVTAYGYASLDLKDTANAFLIEIIRSLIKISFNNSGKRRLLGKRLMSAAIAETKSRQEELSTEEASKAAANEMKRIIDHLAFANRFVQSQPVQAKNILRVILKMNPIVPKNEPGKLFPPEVAALAVKSRRKASIKKTVIKKTTKPRSAEKPASRKQKKKTQPYVNPHSPSADMAISQAQTNVNCDQKAIEKMIAEGTHLQLNGPETLLLTVVCSQGLPVWTDHWYDLIDPSDVDPEKQGPSYQHAITWYGMGGVFQQAAQLWLDQASAKLENKQSHFRLFHRVKADTDPSKVAALKELEKLEQDEYRKRVALAAAFDYCANPEKLAKKCIMLLESVKMHLGDIDTMVPTSQEAIKRQSQTENGLGPLVLDWMSDEINRWATCLNVVDPNGKTLALTALDYDVNEAAKHEATLLKTASLMDSRGCRSLFAQIAQQSRLREVFLRNSVGDVRDMIERSTQTFLAMEEVWEDEPSWWGSSQNSPNTVQQYDINHDYYILDRLLEFGYSGIAETLLELNEENNISPKAETRLTCGSVQIRANRLTRELHVLERANRAIRETVLLSQGAGGFGTPAETAAATFEVTGNGGVVTTATTIEEAALAKPTPAPPREINVAPPGATAFEIAVSLGSRQQGQPPAASEAPPAFLDLTGDD